MSRRTSILIAAAFGAVAVFAVDLAIPLGVAVPVLYVAPLLLGSLTLDRRTVLAVAGLCTVLTPAGWALSAELALGSQVALNRVLALAVVWCTTAVVLHRIRLDREIRRLRDDLEERVRERTAELAASNKELKRSNEELERFAYVASHDLQEPLRSITSYTQLLERRYAEAFDGDAREFMDFIVDGVDRMKARIEALLTCSRVGRVDHGREVVNTGVLAEGAVRNLATAIEESGADVRIEGELPRVEADPSGIRTVFQNLIENAIKYRGEAPPRVRISADRDAEMWRFTVEDNGQGVEERYREQIFRPFQRLHRWEQCPGSGIGLAVCKKVVESHGGDMWVDSGGDGGSAFRFTLPALGEERSDG